MRGLDDGLPADHHPRPGAGARLFPTKEVDHPHGGGACTAYTYADLYRRACRLANALARAGRATTAIASPASPGTRTAISSSTSACRRSGAVLHTLNIRLFPEQITFIVNHAEDAVIFRRRLAGGAARAARQRPAQRARLRRDGRRAAAGDDAAPLYRYEDLLAAASDDYASPAARRARRRRHVLHLGDHRQSEGRRLQSPLAGAAQPGAGRRDSFGLCEADVVMPVVPMFHANAWGMPFTATMVGATQVYPGRAADAAGPRGSSFRTCASPSPAVCPPCSSVCSACSSSSPIDLSSLRCVPCGGSAVPESLLEELR